jgi:hypothetical protein
MTDSGIVNRSISKYDAKMNELKPFPGESTDSAVGYYRGDDLNNHKELRSDFETVEGLY